MPTTSVDNIQVIAIYVSSLDLACAFYAEHLGFCECGEYPPGKLLSSGQVTIYLEQQDNVSRGSCVIPVFGSQSIKGSYQALKAAGVTIRKDLEEFGPEYANFQIADPDGNVIEFAGKP